MTPAKRAGRALSAARDRLWVVLAKNRNVEAAKVVFRSVDTEDLARELAVTDGSGWAFDMPPEYQEQDIRTAPVVQRYRDLAVAMKSYLTGEDS